MVYTRAYASPDILTNAKSFHAANGRLLAMTEAECNESEVECILVSYRLDKPTLCRLLVVAVAVSVASGVLVGLGRRQVDIGITTSNLLVTVLSCVEVPLVWLI